MSHQLWVYTFNIQYDILSYHTLLDLSVSFLSQIWYFLEILSLMCCWKLYSIRLRIISLSDTKFIFEIYLVLFLYHSLYNCLRVHFTYPFIVYHWYYESHLNHKSLKCDNESRTNVSLFITKCEILLRNREKNSINFKWKSIII